MDIRAITSYEHDENSTQTEKASRPIGLLERSKTTLAKVERQLSKVEKKIEKTPIYRARKICRRSLITLGILCTGFGLFFWIATNSKSLSYDGGGTYGPVLFAVGLVLLGVGVTWVTIRYFVKRNKRKAQQRINPNVEALVFENEAYDATAASAEAAKQAAASAPAGKQWHEYDVTVVARDDDVRAQFELEQRRKRLKSARMRRTIHGGADDVTSLRDSSDASTRTQALRRTYGRRETSIIEFEANEHDNAQRNARLTPLSTHDIHVDKPARPQHAVLPQIRRGDLSAPAHRTT